MRRSNFTVTEIRFAVASDDVERDLARVVRVIGSFDVAGEAIDGAAVGAPGWVFARTLGDASDSTLLYYDRDQDGTAFLLPWARVEEALREELGGPVVVGAELDLGDGLRILEDGVFALGGAHGSVALLPDRDDYPLGLAAAVAGRDLVAARIGGRVVVTGRGAPTPGLLQEDLSAGMFGVAALGGRGPALVLWQRGAVSSLVLFRRGDVHQVQLWGPSWVTIEPASLHSHGLQDFVARVVADLGFGVAEGPEGAQLIKQHDLDEQAAVRLRAALRRPEPDFHELLSMLGVPTLAAQVLEGTAELTDLPQAVTFPTSTKIAAVKAEMREPTRLPPDPDVDPPKRRWGRRG